MAATPISKPGRHRTASDRLVYGASPRPAVLIGNQGEGRYFTLSMTQLAVLLKHRKNIPVEGHRSLMWTGALRLAEYKQRER